MLINGLKGSKKKNAFFGTLSWPDVIIYLEQHNIIVTE